MFKHITIHMSAPICACTPPCYTLYVESHPDESRFYVDCTTCKAQLRIPEDKVMVRTAIDKEDK